MFSPCGSYLPYGTAGTILCRYYRLKDIESLVIQCTWMDLGANNSLLGRRDWSDVDMATPHDAHLTFSLNLLCSDKSITSTKAVGFLIQFKYHSAAVFCIVVRQYRFLVDSESPSRIPLRRPRSAEAARHHHQDDII
jgi:hypothetical protein